MLLNKFIFALTRSVLLWCSIGTIVEASSTLEPRCCLAEWAGKILEPPSDYGLLPGETIRFFYPPRNIDYPADLYHSINFTVQLLTSQPESSDTNNLYTQLLSGQATGHYFGHFSGVYGAVNPAPLYLHVPDFSQPPWNSGPLVNKQFYLGVLEEWLEGKTIGTRLSLTSVSLIYNQTKSNPPAPYCAPTWYTKGQGRCGCYSESFCGGAMIELDPRDPTRPIYNRTVASTWEECRDQCDYGEYCYSYQWEASTRDCIQTAFRNPGIKPRAGFYSGITREYCMDYCQFKVTNTTIYG